MFCCLGAVPGMISDVSDWEKLVRVLLDKSARVDERDDAATDLGFHANLGVLAVLLTVAKNPDEDEMVLASAGKSIAEIILHLELPHELANGLLGAARIEALSRLPAREK